MTPLDAEHIIQASDVMETAVASVQLWISGKAQACVVVGPTGAGKSHILSAAARTCTDALVMPPADGTDCTDFVEELKSRTGMQVIADDLDKFPKKMCEDIIKNVALCRHQFLVSFSVMSKRHKNLLSAKWDDAFFVTITDPSLRPEDIEVFVERWLLSQAISPSRRAVSDCSRFCYHSDLPDGFRTVETFLKGLSDNGWDFTEPVQSWALADAYRLATAPPPSKPVVLVEGYTERVYFEWLLAGTSPAPAVEVLDCDGASNVVVQAISARNQGRHCVSILDSDLIGKDKSRQLKDYGHAVVSVPVDALNLPKSAFEHVKEVAEIEDLLPVHIVEEFLRENGLQPELVIRAPTGVRYVIDKNDKRTLANWVVENCERDKVQKLFELLVNSLKLLNITI